MNPISDAHSVFHRNGASLIGVIGSIFAVPLFGWYSILLYILFEIVARFLSHLILGYLFTKNIKSKEIKFVDRSGVFPDVSHIKFFAHEGHDLIARQVFASWYILLPSNWRELLEEDEDVFFCKVAHEVGHCQAGDFVEFIHWLSYGVPMAFATLCMVFAITYATGPIEVLSVDHAIKFTFAFVLSLSIVYMLKQLPRLLLSIEHEADKYAYELAGEDYIAFLEDAAFAEKYSKQKTVRWRFVSAALKNYFHPKFSDRLQYLTCGSVHTDRMKLFDGLAAGTLLTVPPIIVFLYSQHVLGTDGEFSIPTRVLFVYLQTAYLGSAILILSEILSFYNDRKAGRCAKAFVLASLFYCVLLVIFPDANVAAWKVGLLFVTGFFVLRSVSRHAQKLSLMKMTTAKGFQEAYYFIVAFVFSAIFLVLFIENNKWLYISGVVVYFSMRLVARMVGYILFLAKFHPEVFRDQQSYKHLSEDFDFSEISTSNMLDGINLKPFNRFCHDLLFRMHNIKSS